MRSRADTIRTPYEDKWVLGTAPAEAVKPSSGTSPILGAQIVHSRPPRAAAMWEDERPFREPVIARSAKKRSFRWAPIIGSLILVLLFVLVAAAFMGAGGRGIDDPAPPGGSALVAPFSADEGAADLAAVDLTGERTDPTGGSGAGRGLPGSTRRTVTGTQLFGGAGIISAPQGTAAQHDLLPPQSPSGGTHDSLAQRDDSDESDARNRGVAIGAPLEAPVRKDGVQSSSVATRGEHPVQGVPRTRTSTSSVVFPLISDLGRISFTDDSLGVAVAPNGDRLHLTLDQELQLKAREMLQHYRVPWGAIVAIEPSTGKVLALASYSEREPFGAPVALRATFPAASLFKIITAAAAIERSGMSGDDQIFFRGGNYTLSPYNAFPDAKKDRRKMTLAEAMGKSVNPVFARVALGHLSASLLERYAVSFGFNSNLPFDVPLETSTFLRPSNDYELARTSAGFGPVTVSPLHAAAFTAGIANGGVMMRPYLIERVFDVGGKAKYTARPTALRSVVTRDTAAELMEIMVSTVTTGTARRQFFRVKNPLLKSGLIAGKTGTLSGDNPKGVYHWFVAAAPADKPQVAIATLVIDPGTARVKSTALGREFLEYFFRTPGMEHTIEPAGGAPLKIRRGAQKRRAASVRRAPLKVKAARKKRRRR